MTSNTRTPGGQSCSRSARSASSACTAAQLHLFYQTGCPFHSMLVTSHSSELLGEAYAGVAGCMRQAARDAPSVVISPSECASCISNTFCVCRGRFDSITKYASKLADKVQEYGPNHVWVMEVKYQQLRMSFDDDLACL